MPNPIDAGPLVGQLCLPHRANTDATASIVPQRAQKRSRVVNDTEILVSLHQKHDRHRDWMKHQMQSLLVDVNRIRNLSTKNSFVAHEAYQRAWKSLTLLCFEDDLIADGFTE